MTEISAEALREIATRDCPSRFALWTRFIQAGSVREAAEIGVLRGEFAASVLKECDRIVRYYMVDPWRHLGDWNKPANTSDDEFEQIYAEALERTEPWRDKRVVLRGTSAEAMDRIPDRALDFLYVDGDHTLRGIAIDLIAAYDKVRTGGWIAGDDFCPSIWQHGPSFEPTLVFPFAVHFAEAVGQRVFALPHDQFLIEKRADSGFEFCDLTGSFGELGLKGQLRRADPAARFGDGARGRLRAGLRVARRRARAIADR